ncbi:hypothetical protein GH714_026913 [Hevea brasiliensis]|uniref:Pectinesterase inhibitor domain-containing protein n=1 Tax=Hevea brasiliensis TaxID=3981 RepID=A0A6A6N2H3_HEVBR|nr:hypothetical protein GH714_026913 [Hevea brasiliensis]
MGSWTMKLLLLAFIIGGSITCCRGVELESLASQKGRKEEIACQLAGKENIRTTFLACDDVKRNHMNTKEKVRKYETLLPAASEQIVDENLRYNQIIMRRLLRKGQLPPSGRPDPCTSIPGHPSCPSEHG